MKKVHVISGVDLGSCEAGKPAKIFMPDGRILKTSPVESYWAKSGGIYIETRNSIYVDRKNAELYK